MKKYIFLLMVWFFRPGYGQEIKTYSDIELALKDNKNDIKLDLSNQDLKNIPTSVFKIKNLKSLDISGNEITSIPKEIKDLTKLESINISENEISEVSKAFLLLKNLKQVEAGSTMAGEMPLYETASYLKNLNDTKILNSIINLPESEFTMPFGTYKDSPAWSWVNTKTGFVDSYDGRIIQEANTPKSVARLCRVTNIKRHPAADRLLNS